MQGHSRTVKHNCFRLVWYLGGTSNIKPLTSLQWILIQSFQLVHAHSKELSTIVNDYLMITSYTHTCVYTCQWEFNEHINYCSTDASDKQANDSAVEAYEATCILAPCASACSLSLSQGGLLHIHVVKLSMVEKASSSHRICSMHPFITEAPPSYDAL